jgi:hypothetical protein
MSSMSVDNALMERPAAQIPCGLLVTASRFWGQGHHRPAWAGPPTPLAGWRRAGALLRGPHF